MVLKMITFAIPYQKDTPRGCQRGMCPFLLGRELHLQEHFGFVRGLIWPQVDLKVTCTTKSEKPLTLSQSIEKLYHFDISVLMEKSTQNSDF
jgi:hypothetical protein